MNGHSAVVVVSPPSLPLGARLRRAVARALLVGMVTTFVSLVPTLFVQSVFSSEAQRCGDAQQRGVAVDGCAGDLAAATWLPTAIIAGGSLVGLVGGFTYGFFEAHLAYSQWRASRERWLPF